MCARSKLWCYVSLVYIIMCPKSRLWCIVALVYVPQVQTWFWSTCSLSTQVPVYDHEAPLVYKCASGPALGCCIWYYYMIKMECGWLVCDATSKWWLPCSRYIRHTLDQYVEEDYVIVYFHYGLSSRNKPKLSWLMQAYKEFDRK